MANRGKQGFGGFNRLSDRDMIFDLLAGEKQMSHLYDHAIMEASGQQVRETFIALQQDEQRAARMLYEFLQQQGWYTAGAGRQKGGRKIDTSQGLSGGAQGRADSRYAVAAGGSHFGRRLAQEPVRPTGEKARGGHGRQAEYSRSDWNF